MKIAITMLLLMGSLAGFAETLTITAQNYQDSDSANLDIMGFANVHHITEIVTGSDGHIYTLTRTARWEGQNSNPLMDGATYKAEIKGGKMKVGGTTWKIEGVK